MNRETQESRLQRAIAGLRPDEPSPSYAAKEFGRVLEAGPYPDEDFFRVKVTGNGESRWVNVTHDQLSAIVKAVS